MARKPGMNRGDSTLAAFVEGERLKGVRLALSREEELPPLTAERAESVEALQPALKRFHGAKVSAAYFPQSLVNSPCADTFGYLTPARVRRASKLPFRPRIRALLEQLGAFMGTTPPAPAPANARDIPAGYTYFGQFIDHDITMDISSKLEEEQLATAIGNMRSPSLDLDSLYGRGPALSAFLYAFPATGPATAVRFQLGSNRQERSAGVPAGKGGPGGVAGAGGMAAQRDFDVPRVVNPLDPDPIHPTLSTNTAIIGDPRNDENLIVSQFHHAMLKFHNKVVDELVSIGFAEDIFVEAKRLVTHHYQWAVVHDFLKRVCGQSAVDDALANVSAAPNSAFRMPVEFAVAAYRFGHSMIRHEYWLSFAQPAATLGQVFDFVRNDNLPVLTNWTVDFNAFFGTGISVPVNNKALKIDSMLAGGLAALPGFAGMMAQLATRNLLRGLALGLPSGQAVATHFGLAPLTETELKQGLTTAETDLLDSENKVLLKKTPLWYYCLREAAVKESGFQLGPVGARIVAETFVRMLKRDPTSYLNAGTAFAPSLAAATAGDFTVADLVNYAGVTSP